MYEIRKSEDLLMPLLGFLTLVLSLFWWAFHYQTRCHMYHPPLPPPPPHIDPPPELMPLLSQPSLSIIIHRRWQNMVEGQNFTIAPYSRPPFTNCLWQSAKNSPRHSTMVTPWPLFNNTEHHCCCCCFYKLCSRAIHRHGCSSRNHGGSHAIFTI